MPPCACRWIQRRIVAGAGASPGVRGTGVRRARAAPPSPPAEPKQAQPLSRLSWLHKAAASPSNCSLSSPHSDAPRVRASLAWTEPLRRPPSTLAACFKAFTCGLY
eukprot:3575211-Pleurochrysis_carterae.AAC.2